MKTTHCLLATVLALTACLFHGRAAATAQEPDRLLLDGKEESLHTNPLSAWLEQHDEALPRSEYQVTSNWRGYVATWEVANDRLLLRKVEVMVRGPRDAAGEGEFVPRDVARDLFPGGGDIVASWYSGALVIPRGELVNYVHMGYGSDYERYVVLSIKAGRVADRRELTHAQFRDYRQGRYAAWKKTPQYAAALEQLRAGEAGGEWEQSDIDDFFAGFYAEQYLALDPDVEE
jgi:hypothetical protein